MGIEEINISTLTGNLQTLAKVVDDGNGILERKEIELFQNTVKAAGLAEGEDYKAIFGSEIKAAPQVTQPITLSKKEVKTKENAVKDFTAVLVKQHVKPENLMSELNKRFPEAEYKAMLNEVQYVLNLVKDAVAKNPTDPKKAIEKIDDTAKKQMKADKKWDGFHKDIYDALKDQAKDAQIDKEFKALIPRYNAAKGRTTNFEEAVKKVKEELQTKSADGKKEWNKSYTQEAFERLEEYAKQDALGFVDNKLGEKFRGVKDGSVTNDHTKKELKAANTNKDAYINKAIKKRKTEIKVTDRGANVNKRASEISQMTRAELIKELGNELFEKLSRSYLGKIKNDNGTYDLSELTDAILSRTGDDYKINRSTDPNMGELDSIKKDLAHRFGLPLSDERKDTVGLTDNDVKDLIKFCEIKREKKDHCPKIVKAVRDGVVGAAASGGYTKLQQTVTVNIASEDVANTLAELKAQGIDATVTELGEGRVGIRIFQELITPDAIIGLGIGIATGALFDAIFGNERDEKTCINLLDYTGKESRYTNAAEYKEYISTLYAKSPEKVDALHKLVDAYEKTYGDQWHTHFQDALKNIAGIGSKLSPEECRMLKYQKQPEKPAQPQVQPQVQQPVQQPVQQQTCHLDKTSAHVDTTLTHKVKYGDSWEGLVKAYFPTWKECFSTMHGKGGAVQALKRAVAKDDAEYKKLLGGYIPKSINIPETLDGCQRQDDGKVPFKQPKGTPRGYMRSVGKTTGYNTVTLQDCKNISATGRTTQEALDRLNAKTGQQYTEADIVE